MTILTLPLRAAFGAARLGFGAAERLIEALLPGGGNGSSPTPGHVPGAERDEPARPRRPVVPARAPMPDRESGIVVAEPEPEHVSEEPVLVADSADSGAEDGPGAAIGVDEPWSGYRAMKATDVIDRIASASTEELAVVQLHEGAHRRRKTVLAAAERRLRELSPPGRG